MTTETMYCPSCGAQIGRQDAFCGECGRITRPNATTDPDTPPDEPTRIREPNTTPMAAYQPEDPTAVGGARAIDIAKLDNTARVVAVCGLLAFIDSFLPWYTISYSGVGLGSANAWDVDFAWIPMLLLAALGGAILLPAFGVRPPSLLTPLTVTGVGALCAIIVAVRWVTYPSGSDFGVTAGAGFGTYLGLALAILVTALGVRADAAQDRALARLLATLRQRPPAGPTPPPGS